VIFEEKPVAAAVVSYDVTRFRVRAAIGIRLLEFKTYMTIKS